jgi:hypothetical protein
MSVCLLAPAAHAVVVKNLYAASVPVANQSSAARTKALRAALAAVVVKVTGSPPAASAPALTDFLTHPERPLQQYRYEHVKPIVLPGPNRSKAPGRRPQPALHLWAKFDGKLVNQALQNAGLPIWGHERPLTLVWLAKQDKEARTILSADTDTPLERLLKRRAKKRGMAIVLPLMDLEDQRQVSFSDIAGGFLGTIRKASARYHPDAILVGYLQTLAPRVWTARWQLLPGQKTVSWKPQPGKLRSVGAAGINGAANYDASHFALQSNHRGAGGVAIDVSDIDTIGAYARVLKFLQSLTPVQALRVERVAKATVRFRVKTRGTLDNLRQAIELGDLLQPEKKSRGRDVAPARRSHRNRQTSHSGGLPRAPAGRIPRTVLSYRYSP